MLKLFSKVFFLLFFCGFSLKAQEKVGIWMKFEQSFSSSKTYENSLYEIKSFKVKLISPNGRTKLINGFWDGDKNWKFRFSPDETGTWTWETECSDESNEGLHHQKGSFICTANKSKLAIYANGAIQHQKGKYYLSHTDGKPFFWAGCTAWNGTLKSTEQEWNTYLQNRYNNGYSVIQFVTTQWRGADQNSLGQKAFEGSGRIQINPEFFQHLDKKIDQINEHGLVAAPVLLWALATVQGRALSPGYYLPDAEAILLSRYMIARYGANHVVWILGGDGKYTEENEQRWKNIGRQVFADHPPGVAALHPGGTSWIGDVYANEKWLDVIGYQSGHDNSAKTMEFINNGPISNHWYVLPPRPIINMEPIYEEINDQVSADDVRRTSYWSVLNAPTAGITYGANGLWPWLRDGETILNHAAKGEKATRWEQSMSLPGSMQISYLAKYFKTINWWELAPKPELLVNANKNPKDFVAVSTNADQSLIVVYSPTSNQVQIFNSTRKNYTAKWLDPVSNKLEEGTAINENGIIKLTPPSLGKDWLITLQHTK